MHDDMVERVALAISGSDDPANILSIHRGRARAAIEAMREPTNEMRVAGFVAELQSADVWSAMIDAVLQKDTGG